MLSVLFLLESKMIAKSLQREWLRAKTDTDGGMNAKLLLFLVNLCAKVRSQCFLAKAI
jgi:hypothetical protein